MLKKIFILFIISVNFLFVNSCSTKTNESKSTNLVDEGLTNDALKMLGDSLYNKNDFESALHYFYELIEDRSVSNGEIFYKIGYCNAQLLNFEESTKFYIMATDLGYRTGDAFYNAGVNQTLDLDDSLAIIYFKKAIQVNPEDTLAMYELENAEKRLKAYKEVFENDN